MICYDFFSIVAACLQAFKLTKLEACDVSTSDTNVVHSHLLLGCSLNLGQHSSFSLYLSESIKTKQLKSQSDGLLLPFLRKHV